MIKLQSLLILLFLIISSPSFSQKLKKSDKELTESLRSHVAFLSDEKLQGCVAGSEGEHAANEYVAAELRRNGLKPGGDSSTWQQRFQIPDGRNILPATHFSVNDKDLVLYTDYFPFAFSAPKKTEASVAMALAEPGVPWFTNLKELLDENRDSTLQKDTSAIVASRAKRAEKKGATALVVYNNSIIRDIRFDGMDTGKEAGIPVVYITHSAAKKYLSKESSLLDVKMNVALENRVKNTCNVVGVIDNRAKRTALVAAHLDQADDVSALIALSKILRGRAYRFSNYLFVVYPAERGGASGQEYFKAHDGAHNIDHVINLDSAEEKGISQVKNVMDEINGLKGK